MNNEMKRAVAWGAFGLGAWVLHELGRASAYSFKDKSVFVTGGSRGLGLVLARELTKEGARVGICAREWPELSRAANDIKQFGRMPNIFRCDVTDPAQVCETARSFHKTVGPVDVLINNAGIIAVGPMSTMRREDYQEALDVSFWGVFNTTEAFTPTMRRRRSGRIVNICSIGGKISIPHLLPYSVGKFALSGYSEGLRAELANNGITVTTIYPGLMRTGSPRNAWFKGQNRKEYSWFTIGDSLPFLTISAEHAARAILNACRRGDAQTVLSLPAKVAVKMHELFPELTAGMLDVSNRAMPRPNGAGPERHRGKDSESPVAPSPLTALTERAARRNNEMSPNPR